MSTIADLLVRIRGDSSQFQREVAKATATTKGFGASTAATFAKVGVGAAATAGIVGGIFTAHAISSAIKYESAFAGVKKTVEATPAEFAKIRKELLDLSTQIPTSANNLAKIGESAGQLGIHKDAIVDFTRVIADLGETTNLAGEEGATMLARFANITQMSQRDFDRLGSTIVALGNAGASTESEIANMAMRIAGSGHLVGMTEAEILGVAEAMSSLGLEAELGGTAISRTLAEMAKAVSKGGDDLKRWALIAGQSADDFARLFKERPTAALQAVIDGLGNLHDNGVDLYSVLEKVGLGGVRVTDTLLRASGAGDLVNRSIANANTAWAENNALTEEARKRYETTAAKLQVLKNRFERFAIDVGTQMLPTVNRALDGISKWFDDHGEQMIDGWKASWERLLPVLDGTWKTLSAIYDVANKIVDSSPFQLVLDVTVVGLDMLSQTLGMLADLPGTVGKARNLIDELGSVVGRQFNASGLSGKTGFVGIVKNVMTGNLKGAFTQTRQAEQEFKAATARALATPAPIVGGDVPLDEFMDTARAYASVADAIEETGKAAAGAAPDMSLFNDLFGDDTTADIEERSRQAAELARAWVEGGAEMAAAVQAFHDRANALWPSVVAEAAAAGVQLTEDDRASWEARLNNGENIVDQLLRLQEERVAREKKLATEVKEAWLAGGAEMAAKVRAHQIELDAQWEQVVASARDAGIELVAADREMWEARLNNGERYIDQLIRQEQELAEARRRLNSELVEAFDRGGADLVARVRRLHADLDAQWAAFVARARAAGLEVVDADRAAWESRMLNGRSAVDYLISLEEELAAERKRAAEQAKADAIAAVDQLGGLLETALQRKYAAEEQAAVAAIQSQIEAAQDASRARIEQIDREEQAALAALDAQATRAREVSEAMTRALVAPIEAQIKALDELDYVDDLQAIADQLKITYDPREEKKLLDQKKRLERDHLRDQLRDRITEIEDRARREVEIVEESMRAQREAIEARYDAQREAEERALEATTRGLQGQLDATRAKYAEMTSAYRIQSEVRQMLASGEVAKMAALLDEFVPEWRTAGLSYGQMMIDGIRTSGVEAYIAGVLAQVQAANAAVQQLAATTAAATGTSTAPTAADKLADQLSIKALVDGGAPQAAIDAQRASYQQIYGEPSPYARGGVFSRPGLGLFGEYPTARTDPEVASPVSVLQDAMREVIAEAGSGGPGVTVEVYLGRERLTQIVEDVIVRRERGRYRDARLAGAVR